MASAACGRLRVDGGALERKREATELIPAYDSTGTRLA
jgi:hypothetical protein